MTGLELAPTNILDVQHTLKHNYNWTSTKTFFSESKLNDYSENHPTMLYDKSASTEKAIVMTPEWK
jgi:hypothetical protein